MSQAALDAPRHVSLELRRHAALAPERPAVVDARGSATSFGALERRADALARGLAREGLGRGDRVSLFLRPGADLVAVVHALLRLGAVPVLIDPGMGREHLLACVERVAPRALVGVPRAHAARFFFPRAFRSVEIAVVASRAGLGRGTLAEVERRGAAPGAFDPAPVDPDDVAAILFTSGSTGPPKGCLATHGNLAAELDALRALYDLGPGGVDAACFPLFALFDNALGMTSVFPDLDPTRPAACDPAKVVQAIERWRATFSFGSPAIWHRVVPWMERAERRFTTLARVTIAGAPVPPDLVLRLAALLPEQGRVHTPYGATESLPVADVDDREIARVRATVEAGAATCVGRKAPGVELAVIRVDDGPIERFDPALVLPEGAVGELCVKSPQTTRGYAGDPAATRLARIPDPRGGAWHRMGDLGYVDGDGRTWFVGRKAHRIETAAGPMYPVPVENAFQGLPGVHRVALVGVGPRGAERPVLVVEPERGASRARALEAARRRAGERSVLFVHAPLRAVLCHPRFPVDVRHNAKIRRLALKAWAERRLA